MTHYRTTIHSSRKRAHRLQLGVVAALAVAVIGGIAGCNSGSAERASEMTSYSSKEAKGGAAELFTIPQEQMSHIEVVTIAPAKMIRKLRLTGAVAYNAFATTPVITQVGGPVSRILVVPGEFVKKGQPLLEVSSPDYSQMLAVYLKARDVLRVASKNWDRAQDLYQHHAIAERDLLQAESDRNQAQADMNAAEQSIKILGIPKPEDLEKSPSSAEMRLLAPISGQVVERLVAMSYDERAANPCIGTERADLVLAGCAILEAIRRAFPCPRLRVADRGLREGMLVQLMRADGVWDATNG